MKKTNKGIASSILTWGSKIDFAQNVPKLRQTTKNGYTKHKNNQKKKKIFFTFGVKITLFDPVLCRFLVSQDLVFFVVFDQKSGFVGFWR